MIRDLVKLADKLDGAGLSKEADVLDGMLRKLAELSGEDYRALLAKVCEAFNSKHSKLRARTGMQNGMLSILVGGQSKPNYAVVGEPGKADFASSAELMTEIKSILRYQKGTHSELAPLDIVSSEVMHLEDVDQDDEKPETVPEGYSVWVLKSNIDDSLLHRAGKALGLV